MTGGSCTLVQIVRKASEDMIFSLLPLTTKWNRGLHHTICYHRSTVGKTKWILDCQRMAGMHFLHLTEKTGWEDWIFIMSTLTSRKNLKSRRANLVIFIRSVLFDLFRLTAGRT